MRILIIARHYPPEISGGARRPYLMAQEFRRRGHTVTVVSPFLLDDKDICIPSIAIENGLKKNADTSFAVQKISRKTKVKDFARLWLNWPDPNISWCKSVLKHLKSLPLDYDWVITTSPPESVHVIGAQVAEHCGAKWLAEFRDTWIAHPHRKVLESSYFRRVGEGVIARRAMKKVDAVSAVSDAVMNDVDMFIPNKTPRCIVGHFSAPSAKVIDLPEGHFNLVHSGGFTLSDRRRHLGPILKALEDAKNPKLHIHIAGRLSQKEIAQLQSAKAFHTTHHGQLSLEDSQALQAGADALLLITPPNSHALPGKYSEYRLAKKPVLFQGGGSWLNLIDNHEALFPLEEGLNLIGDNALPSVKANPHYFSENVLKDFLTFLETS